MARILLTAEGEGLLANLRSMLERCSHSVTISTSPPAEILRRAHDLTVSFDLLLLEVSCVELSVLESLLRFPKRSLSVSGCPFILGFSTKRRGPRFLLLLERAGIRYVRLAQV